MAEFVEDHPDLAWAVDAGQNLFREASVYERHNLAASTWLEMDDDRRLLLLTAIALVREFEIPLEQVPAVLVPFII